MFIYHQLLSALSSISINCSPLQSSLMLLSLWQVISNIISLACTFLFESTLQLAVTSIIILIVCSDVACNITVAACNVFAKQAGKPPLYWLQSLLLVIFAGCGGGVATGMYLGRPMGLASNADIFIPLCLIAWYTTHTLGFSRIYTSLPVRVITGIFVSLWRTHTICDTVNVAKGVLSPSAYYPTPFFGPVVAGTFTGCFGAFLPFDKGLTPLNNGTPWPVQISFLTAFFYHAMLNDTKGFIGIGCRSIFGPYAESDVRVIIATVHIISSLLQNIFDAEANIFTPFHKVGYLFFQVTGPSGANTNKSMTDTVGWDYQTRYFLEKTLEALRIVAVIAALIGHIYLTQPPSALMSGQFFKVGDAIGTCQFLSTIQKCTPYVFQLEIKPGDNKLVTLASYKAKGKSYVPAPEEVPAWSLKIKLNGKVKLSNSTEQGVVLGEDGVLRFIIRSPESQQDELLWSSSSKCPTGTTEGSKTLFLSLNADGQAVVTCSDGSLVPLI